MTAVAIWGTALLLYGLFWLWYVGLPRPLTPAEIDAQMARIPAASLDVTADQLATMRRFLEQDDGREFHMLNVVKVRPGEVVAPGGGEPRRARGVLDGYSRHFMPALFRRAGHPAYFGRAAGGELERWGVEPDPGWSFAAAIRYRSRRDMIALVTDPRFADAHAFKRAAIESTFAFPTAPGFVTVGPRVWVGLVLALLAALGHLGFLLSRTTR